MNIILLPGLDGTGKLYQPLVQLLDKDLPVKVVNLNQLPREYEVEAVEQLLEGEDNIILAESFSGHLAHQIATRQPNRISNVIVAASFLHRPSKLTAFRKLLPLSLVKRQVIPSSWVGKIAFGQRVSQELIALFYSALSSVDDDLVRQRLDKVHTLKVGGQQVSVPCIYVGAKNDYLIRRSCYKDFETIFVNFRRLEVDGGHFIVQSNPKAFADIIMTLVK